MRRVLRRAGIIACQVALLAGSMAAADLAEKGKLRILRHGQAIGSERYEVVVTATEVQTRGELEITVDNVTVRQSSSLLLTAGLVPRHYELKVEQPENTWRRIDFSGTTATAHYPLGEGKEDEQVFQFGADRVAVLGLYHDFALLARLYDFSKGGAQSIRVFVPWSLQPGEALVEMKGVEKQTVNGREQLVRQLLIATEDSQIQLWVTEDGRFVRLVAPLEGVEVLPEP